MLIGYGRGRGSLDNITILLSELNKKYASVELRGLNPLISFKLHSGVIMVDHSSIGRVT